MTGLEVWIEEEARFSAQEMMRAISATGIVKERPGFGQRVVPLPGSVLASPVPAAYDPDPDYFFHWFRDAAIVIDAMRVAFADGWLGAEAIERFREFVGFSQTVSRLDGRTFLAQGDFRARVRPSFLQYLRSDAEIAAVRDGAVLADVRVNPDGTLDFTRWSRPQTDGAALLALALMRWDAERDLDDELRAAVRELIASCLTFTLSRASQPSFDIWEEESGFHYFTGLVQTEALGRGATWLEDTGEEATIAQACRTAAREIASRLDTMWDAELGCYRSRTGVADGDPRKARDIAVVLAILHAGRETGKHSVLDPKAQASLATLEDLFDAEYALNRGRADDRGPAMGRYPGDGYFSGGAWYVSTLAAAEFYFKLSTKLLSGAAVALTSENARFRSRLALDDGAPNAAMAAAALARGDAFMRTVRAFTPESGELSEQFDRTTGAQTSAKRLTWSYAALITAAASRRRACAAIRASRPYATAPGRARQGASQSLGERRTHDV